MKAIARTGKWEIIVENPSPSALAREIKEFIDEIERIKTLPRKSASKRKRK